MTAGTSVDAARRGEQGVGDGAVQPGDGDRAVEGRRGRVGLGRGQRRDQASRHGGRLRREHVRQVGADRERGPQQVGGQYERKRSLAVVTAGRQHCGTGLGHLLAEFGDKPGLAAAGLAGDRHHPPVPPAACQAERRAANSTSLPTSGQVTGAGGPLWSGSPPARDGGGSSRPARTSS
jgi:hypothetical protein